MLLNDNEFKTLEELKFKPRILKLNHNKNINESKRKTAERGKIPTTAKMKNKKQEKNCKYTCS